MIANINEALSNKLSIILKTDVQGSLEAIQQILDTINSEEIKLDIFSAGIGDVTERDIQTAQTGKAIIYGFNVLPSDRDDPPRCLDYMPTASQAHTYVDPHDLPSCLDPSWA